MKHIVGFSGGKDSTALICWAKENVGEFETIFCDTGWEHPLTYTYIDYINRELLNGQLKVLNSKKYAGMRELVTKRGRVPSTMRRFCTQELKIFPTIDYLHSIDDEVSFYQGIRAEESASRALLKEEQWSDDYDALIKRPLLAWGTNEVFDIIERFKIEPNPLYKLGASRVGCFPCIMVNKGELTRVGKLLPEIWERAKELEILAGRSFFPSGYIPDKWCSGFDVKSGKKYPTVEDVKKYVEMPELQLSFFNEKPSSCMSIYNLCE